MPISSLRLTPWLFMASLALPGLANADQNVLNSSELRDSGVMTLSKSARVSLEPGAELDRMRSVRLPLPGASSSRVHQIRLNRGTVQIEVDAEPLDLFNVRVVDDRLVETNERASEGPVLVRTPGGDVAIIVQGLATVRVEDGRFTVVNRSGRTLVGTAQSVTSLPAGHAKATGCEGPEVRPLLEAPRFEPGQRVWVTTGDTKARPASVAWLPSDNAERYRAALRPAGALAPVLQVHAEGHQLGDSVPALAPGRYDMQVRAVDACGIEGATSKLESLRVVGVGLPLGAFVDENGTIRMETNSRVHLSFADGLLAGSPGVNVWHAAPSEVGMLRGEHRTVSVRLPGGEPTSFRLAPRDLHASVEMGPQNPTWPQQSIDVTVRLEGGGGQPAPGWLEPTAKVLLGTEPLYVRWKREGNMLRATIPPQPAECPCVVRVIVTDQYGLSLGQGFVEVASSSSRAVRPGAPRAIASRTVTWRSE
jgi:hypothetical protein